MKAYAWTRFHDERIRRAYDSGENGVIRRLAAEFRVTPGAIRLRGIKIGAAVPRRPTGGRKGWWSRAEDKIVFRHLHEGTAAIVKALRKAGYVRDNRAVSAHVHLLRLRGEAGQLNEILEERDEYSPSQIAAALGMSNRAVNCWILKGWLNARPCGKAGDRDRNAVSRKELRAFLINSVQLWDHRRADRFWLVDILADGRYLPSRRTLDEIA